MNSCCCGNCATIFKLKPDLSVQWFQNFYFDYDANSIDPYGGSSNNYQTVYACDEDADGNVYQVGSYAGHCMQMLGLVLLPQTTPLYTIRSWDKDGNLRWGWSEAIYGTPSPDGIGRIPPVTLTSCRVANNVIGDYGTYGGTGQMILVGTDANAGTGLGSTVTALDTDGNMLWRTVFNRFTARVHSVSATTSLWRITGEVFPGDSTRYALSSGWLIMNNANGSVLFCSLTDSSWSIGGVAAMDADGLVYEMVGDFELYSDLTSSRVGVTRVTRYSSNGSNIDWSVASPYMSGGLGNPFPINGAAAGSGFDLSLEAETLVVSTGSAFERFTKSNGSHVSIRRTPVSTLYVTDDGGIAAATQVEDYTYRFQGAFAVFTHSGDRWKMWEGGTVADARRTADGGMLVSAQKNCPNLGLPPGEMGDDTNWEIISCSSQASFDAVSVSQYGIFNMTNGTGKGYTDWSTSSGCSAGCLSLSVDLVAAVSNTYYGRGGFGGYQVVAGYPVGNVAANLAANTSLESGTPAIPAPSAGDVVSFDCF
ncbi:MAG: hypothetical protein WCH39_07365 [Schlesneria sp.]